jgi:hypothetical protein
MGTPSSAASTNQNHGRDLDPLAMARACLNSGVLYIDRALKFLTDVEHLGRRGCRLSSKQLEWLTAPHAQGAEVCGMRP